ncbi:MAG: glycogen synthase GlgA [bacterium]
MRILFVASEAVPFAKTGGLADVAGAVPKALRARGEDIALALPYYRTVRERFAPQVHDTDIRLTVPLGKKTLPGALRRTVLPESDVPVYLIENPELFDRQELYSTPRGDYSDNDQRFIFFSRAVLQAMEALGWQPDLYHCNDWQTALIPAYLKTLCAQDSFFRGARSLLTIHNLAYQGTFEAQAFELTGLGPSHFNWQEFEFYQKFNILKGGLVFADLLNTVSPRYAKEIQTEEFGCGLQGVLASRADDLYGIINGIDYTVWNPATDDLIPARYSPDDLGGKAVCKRELQKECGLPRSDAPLLGLISRLADQKGLDLIAEAMEPLMALDVQFVLLGTGQEKYHKLFASLAKKHRRKFAAHITFDNALAHRIEAGCDMYLMPSRYEPCGLNQLFSLKYGTVPIVRRTGGLADTITNCTPTSLAKGKANGFSFESYSSRALLATIKRALKLYAMPQRWRRLMLVGMGQDWSWERSAGEYLKLYREAHA